MLRELAIGYRYMTYRARTRLSLFHEAISSPLPQRPPEAEKLYQENLQKLYADQHTEQQQHVRAMSWGKSGPRMCIKPLFQNAQQ